MDFDNFSNEQIDILNAIHAALIFLDKDGVPFFRNEFTESLLGIEADSDLPAALVDKLKSVTVKDSSLKNGMFNIKYCEGSEDEKLIQIKYSRREDGDFLLTLRDISKEAHLIKEFAIINKELDATKILLDRRKHEKEVIQKNLEKVIENLPEELMIVNSIFTIKETNIRWEKEGITKCYQYFGHDEPCPVCLLKDGVGGEKKLLVHKHSNRYIQETLTPLPNRSGGALLTFQDATSKITLIEQIRQQQETIGAKNDLLQSLVELMLLMHNSSNVLEVSNHFLDTVIEKNGAKAGLLFVKGERQGTLWVKIGRNIPEAVIDKLTKRFQSLSIREQKFSSFQTDDLPVPAEEWIRVELIGSDDSQAGLLMLDTKLTPEKEQLITLYTEPMGSFIDNCHLNRKLENFAHHDGLTGLYNRRYLLQAIDDEERRYMDHKIPYSLVLCDANGLKFINDTYGHEFGDQYLIKIAECLKNTVRETDVVARLGGDEYCILMPDTGASTEEIFLRRLRDNCQRHQVEVNEDLKVPVSMSMGFCSRQNESAEDLMKVADELMYEDKKKHYKNKKMRRRE